MASMNSSSLSRSESVSRRGFLFRLVKSISMLAIVSVVVVLTCSQVSCAPADHPTEAVPRGLSVLGDVFTAGPTGSPVHGRSQQASRCHRGPGWTERGQLATQRP